MCYDKKKNRKLGNRIEYILDIIKKCYAKNNAVVECDENDIISVSSNGKIIFTVDSNALYRDFIESDYADLEEYVTERVAEVNAIFVSDVLVDYNFVKEHIYIAIINAEKNEDYLEYIPYVEICDLAMVYCFDFNGAYVTNESLTRWCVSKDQLHKDAIENSQKIRPRHIEKLSDFFSDILGEEQADAGVVLVTNRILMRVQASCSIQV